MKRLAALRSQSFFFVPSCLTIGSGMSGITARQSGWMIEAPTHPRVTWRVGNAIDGLQIAFCPLFVKGEQGRGFERKHGECRHQRIAQGNLHLVDAIVRDGGEVLAKQAEERIGTEMFASFWHHDGHSNPQPDIIHVRNRSHEGRIVAFMFTKSQRGCRRGYWDLSTSGNCWSMSFTAQRGSSCTSIVMACSARA